MLVARLHDIDALAASVHALIKACKANGKLPIVTSTLPGEGKSFVATNLALTYYGTLSSSAKSALFVDGTHFHEPGATQIANLVAQAMKGLNVGLQSYVR